MIEFNFIRRGCVVGNAQMLGGLELNTHLRSISRHLRRLLLHHHSVGLVIGETQCLTVPIYPNKRRGGLYHQFQF